MGDPAIVAARAEHQYESAEIILELARERQLAQLQQIDGLDTKAATLLGFDGVLLGLVFSSGLAAAHWNDWLSAGAALLALAMLLLGLALLPRRYKFNPNIAALEERFLNRPKAETQAVVVSSIRRAIRDNADRTRRKAALIRLGAIATMVAVGVIAATLISQAN